MGLNCVMRSNHVLTWCDYMYTLYAGSFVLLHISLQTAGFTFANVFSLSEPISVEQKAKLQLYKKKMNNYKSSFESLTQSKH